MGDGKITPKPFSGERTDGKITQPDAGTLQRRECGVTTSSLELKSGFGTRWRRGGEAWVWETLRGRKPCCKPRARRGCGTRPQHIVRGAGDSPALLRIPLSPHRVPPALSPVPPFRSSPTGKGTAQRCGSSRAHSVSPALQQPLVTAQKQPTPPQSLFPSSAPLLLRDRPPGPLI